MSLIMLDDDIQNHVDPVLQRISAGTLGSDHVQTKGLLGSNASSIVDDQDPRITYFDFNTGAVFSADTINVTQQDGNMISQDGTTTILGGTAGTGYAGAAAIYRFQGTSIGVLGSFNPNAGMMYVYIDGQLTNGKCIANSCLMNSSASVNQPVIDAVATTIPTLNNSLINFNNSTVVIGAELITYTSKTGNSLVGCTRGAFGTTAVPHYANETIYSYGSSIDTYSTPVGAVGIRQLQWYKNDLGAGQHNIMVLAWSGSSGGNNRVFFDGFVEGPLVGARNIFTNSSTVTFSFTTDANGHSDIGQVVSTNDDNSLISVLGYTQTTPSTETSNTTALGRLGWRYNTSGVTSQPYLYYHNGPPSASVTIMVSFAFLGQSI